MRSAKWSKGGGELEEKKAGSRYRGWKRSVSTDMRNLLTYGTIGYVLQSIVGLDA